LVGSIGLGGVDEVFRTVGPALGRRLKRIPDGEPGPRRLWVSFQYPLLRSSPFLRPDPSGALRKTSGFPLLCLAEGVRGDEVEFGELGYAREARGSYLDFLAARDCGDIAKGTRFQVCLPTPMSVIYAFCTARDVAAIEPAYEKAMAREVEQICRHIPHQDLCIQWDVCHDMIVWDGQPQEQFPLVNASKEDITQRFVRICDPVPDNVELGFHLCYGDFGGKHFFDPVTARHLVDISNAIVKNVRHKVAYIHLPVPAPRYRRFLCAHERAAQGRRDLSRHYSRRGRRRRRAKTHRTCAHICAGIRNCDGMRLRSRAQARSGAEADRYSRRGGEGAGMIRVP
ncbi:MAG TPA: hypothetical protein VFX32_05455, partial [Pseudolabrys sp.]|nr:hypothetical protein [Pseudolabrys sp.]